MHAWPHQQQAGLRLPGGHWALWWEPGVGKTLPLAQAGRDIGLPQLWLTLSQGGLLPVQTAEAVGGARGDRARIQVVRSQRDTIDPRADVVVCSYDLMRTKPLWRQLFQLSWGSLVLDEAHALANSASTRTRAIYGAQQTSKGALFRRAAHVWPSTGTPVLNNPLDLWPHVSRLWPGISLPTKQAWLDEYCITRRGDFGLQVVGGRNLGELRRKLLSVSSILRLEDTAPDMPPLTVDTLRIELGGKERQRLNEALRVEMTPTLQVELESVLAEIDGGAEWEAARLEAMALSLAGVRRVLALIKAPLVTQLVRGELIGGADRVLVFGHHRAALEHVAAQFRGRTPCLIHGGTPPGDRQAAVDAFRDGSNPVLVANITAGGTGLNLQACRRVIFLEAMWTPAPNRQAIARCYRAGQRRPVHASFCAVPRSLDAAVTGVLARKARVIKGIMGHA